ncbi:MAG: hypothetical protein AAB879_03685, partial [Patescibacteria group bacterium]
LGLNAAKEKLEIVSGAAHFNFVQYKPPPFRIFAGGLPRLSTSSWRNAPVLSGVEGFGLIQVSCTIRSAGENDYDAAHALMEGFRMTRTPTKSKIFDK